MTNNHHFHHDYYHDDIPWVDFKSYSIEEKIDYFEKKNIFHTLFAEQFNRKLLDQIYFLTNTIREISKVEKGKQFLASLLQYKRAMLYFIQPSTRTFLSFSSACHILGLQTFSVRSAQISSEIKGESFEDTIRTFSSYFSLIVMRYPQPFYAERAALALSKSYRPLPIINAGSGKDQHPTQALLDIYTLRRSFEKEKDFKNKTILLVGDLKRGRTVRSLSYILSEFKNIHQIFVSPKEYQIGNDIKEYLRKKKVRFSQTTDFVTAIKEADAIYMTRLQDEYEFSSNRKAPVFNIDDYSFKTSYLKILKPHAVILHPLPRRTEIEIGVDKDKRAMYWRQMRNGMWTRVALIAKIFGLEKKILTFLQKNKR